MSAASNRARESAAHWLALRHSGEMTPGDEHAFRLWLDESEAHEAAWLQLQRVWALTGIVAEDPRIRRDLSEDVMSEEVTPEEGVSPPVSRQRWRVMGIAAAALLALTGTWAAGRAGFIDGLDPAQYAGGQSFQTGIGQRTVVTLSDGSVVTLDSDSEVRVHGMAPTRSLQLVRGRAFFRVAKDAAHPFTVRTGDKTVRALGTAFGVRIDDKDVVVTLIEGKVRVEEKRSFFGSPHSAELTAGAALVARPDDKWTIARIDPARETSWLEGRLTFLRDNLAKATSEMNRYSDRKLVFAGGRIPDQHIIGVFRAGDVDSFAQAIELNGFARISAKRADRIELTAK